jgi:hypothetical protein
MAPTLLLAEPARSWRVGEEQTVNQADVERIAQAVVREYGLPLTSEVAAESSGGWTVAFTDAWGYTPHIRVTIRYSATSPYAVRESLKRKLEVSEE